MFPTSLLRLLKHRLFPTYASPAKYWRKRYSKYDGSFRAPGCVMLDDGRNQQNYATKWAHIRASLPAENPSGKTLLDAGCGSGLFTSQLVELGYTVSAVDFAENAVQRARQRIGEHVTWYQASLDDFAPGLTFDVVVCIDVLFHITDDEIFRRTIANLARLTAPRGHLVVQEHLVPDSEVVTIYSPTAHHARWRSLDRYLGVLAAEWTLAEHDHYELPLEQTTKDLLRFTLREGQELPL